MEMQPLGGFANFSAEYLAEKTYNSVRTARRWKQQGLAPTLVVAWLELLHYGALGMLSSAFDSWRLYRDVIHAPNGWTFSAGQILAMPLHYQREAALETALLSTAKPAILATRRKSALSHFSHASPSSTSSQALPLES